MYDIHITNLCEYNNYLSYVPYDHSFNWTPRSNAVRRKNVADLNKYIREAGEGGSLIEESEELDLPRLAEERLIIGLRTRKGIFFEELKSHYQYTLNAAQEEWRDFQIDAGNVVGGRGGLTLTEEGGRKSTRLNCSHVAIPYAV